jgi:hypothetical protein
VKLTFSAAMLFGLTVTLFQGSPAQEQTGEGSTLQVVPTPNENFNSELFAASEFGTFGIEAFLEPRAILES